MSILPKSSTRPEAPENRWFALAVLYLASFMNLIDISIVNVALPQIQVDTGATSTQLKWVAEAYVLALAVGLLPCGRFGDVFGRARLFLWGLVGFTSASAVCGLAPNIESLIAARWVQGLAAAMMVPQVLAIVHVIFPAQEKARVFGLFGTVSSLGVVAGPVLGGALISADFAGLGWRLAFLINIPLGVMAVVGARIWLPASSTVGTVRPDWIGSVLFAAATLCLVLPLIEGRSLGWPWWVFAGMFAVVPFAVAFVVHQRRHSAQGLSALMPPGLLGNRPYLSQLGLVTLFFSGIPGLFLVLAIFLQSGFHLSPLQSGLATTPFPVGVMLASMATQRFGDRFLLQRIAGGAAMLVVGMVGLLLVLRAIETDIFVYGLVAPLLLCGIGMGTAVMSLFQVTMSYVSTEDAGAGSGAMQAFQQIGAALGIAITGQIFFGVLGEVGLIDTGQSAQRFVHAASWATAYPISVFAVLTAFVTQQIWFHQKPAH